MDGLKVAVLIMAHLTATSADIQYATVISNMQQIEIIKKWRSWKIEKTTHRYAG